jgi:hypothetical protein
VVQQRTVLQQPIPDGGYWDLVPIDEMSIDLRLRAEWEAPDAVTGAVEIQKSRWWPLSTHMVKTEVVQTAFLCVLKAEEHEIRETFLYKERAVFNTHIAIDKLWEKADNVDVRNDTREAQSEGRAEDEASTQAARN